MQQSFKEVDYLLVPDWVACERNVNDFVLADQELQNKVCVFKSCAREIQLLPSSKMLLQKRADHLKL